MQLWEITQKVSKYEDLLFTIVLDFLHKCCSDNFALAIICWCTLKKIQISFSKSLGNCHAPRLISKTHIIYSIFHLCDQIVVYINVDREMCFTIIWTLQSGSSCLINQILLKCSNDHPSIFYFMLRALFFSRDLYFCPNLLII